MNSTPKAIVPLTKINTTLFNACKSSNIIFKINHSLQPTQIRMLNNLPTYTKRLEWLTENNFQLSYYKLHNETFKTNLELIDSRLPEILAAIIKSRFTNQINNISELSRMLFETNPCDYNLTINPNFYVYKIKRLLVDSALGLTAGKVWTGIYDATGGYIVVKSDGNLVCFHIYNWNEFQDYLFEHTKIDAPDSSPNRCDYGRILNSDAVGEASGTYIKLNFQIRFR
jgi:type II restriction enzyme